MSVLLARDVRHTKTKSVKFAVGDRTFRTTIPTLTHEPGSYFDKLFKGDWEKLVNQSGAIPLDRDAEMFHYIMEYHRDGPLMVLPTESLRTMHFIQQEAKHFSIQNMTKFVAQAIKEERKKKVQTMEKEAVEEEKKKKIEKTAEQTRKMAAKSDRLMVRSLVDSVTATKTLPKTRKVGPEDSKTCPSDKQPSFGTGLSKEIIQELENDEHHHHDKYEPRWIDLTENQATTDYSDVVVLRFVHPKFNDLEPSFAPVDVKISLDVLTRHRNSWFGEMFCTEAMMDALTQDDEGRFIILREKYRASVGVLKTMVDGMKKKGFLRCPCLYRDMMDEAEYFKLDEVYSAIKEERCRTTPAIPALFEPQPFPARRMSF